MGKLYNICTRCVMDTSAKEIVFDSNGVCNFCTEFIDRSGALITRSIEKKEKDLQRFIDEVKSNGKGKPYDCIVGISGGVDSSWVLVKAVELGLRPLAVHMNSGWNSELASHNMKSIVTKLKVDYHEVVIDPTEYRKLLLAFLDADVIDIELLYDNTMYAINYDFANKYNIKYILSGSNQVTEGMRIPIGWNWFKRDKKNIKNIANKVGGFKVEKIPLFGTFDFIKNKFIKRIEWTSILDLLDYNKNDVLNILSKDFDYIPYPYKHYESIFTRFYQGYILPEKFDVDKRRVHLSCLIISSQLTRQEALDDLLKSPYPSKEDFEHDLSRFKSALGWNDLDVANYLSRAEIPHYKYGSEKPLWDFFEFCYRKLF